MLGEISTFNDSPEFEQRVVRKQHAYTCYYSVTTVEGVNVTCEGGAGGSLHVGVEERGRTHGGAVGTPHCPSWAPDSNME